MATRQELIAQARAEQRERTIVARADNSKPAMVGIGDRDPRTGQYEVLLPDGSVEMGEKQFNSSLPKGSQVLGIPQETGGWLLDERDVQPTKPTPQPSASGKVKILYSKFEGGSQVFYLWGDRPSPKKIGSISTGNTLFFNQISNRGSGDKFIVGLRWQDDTTGKFSTQSLGDQKWLYADEPIDAPGYARKDFYSGHGFWASNSILLGYDPAKQPINYSLYKGIRTDFAATRSPTRYDAIRPIAPNLIKTEFGDYVVSGVFDFANPVAVSKDYKSALYQRRFGSGADAGTAEYRLVTRASEIVLGGDIPSLISDYREGNLIRGTYYQVQIPAGYAGSQWSVVVRKLSAATTKTTIRASVTYKHKSDQFVHSASYHP